MSRVVVVPYDPQWPRTFDAIHDTLWPVVQHAAMRLEHVGSTAVPGLSAKPVVDACIVVASPRDLPYIIRALATLGYTSRGNLGVPDREAFAAPPSLPRHHLYASPRHSLSLRNQLGLRDFLRAHPEVAAAYGDLKMDLARQFPDDIDRYMAGKTEFILEILRSAGLTDAELDAIRRINQPEVPPAAGRPPRER